MRKLTICGVVAAALCAGLVSVPANAASQQARAANDQGVAQTFSARRYHHHYRHYGHYGPRVYYGRPYYYNYPYGYAYAPRYYRHRYYRRPGIYFGFGF